MARRFGSFGILALVIVVAIVLMLVARSWRSVAPAAAGPAGIAPSVADPETARAMSDLPNLDEARSRTDEHAKAVGEALAETE